MAGYRRAIAIRPDLVVERNNLANVLLNQGKHDEAAAEFEQVLALKPDYAEAYNDWGVALRLDHQLDQAATRFQQALVLKPDYAEAHNNLGNILCQQGKFAEAATRFDRALALRPDYAEAHYDRGGLKTYRSDDADLAALEALAANPDRLPAEKMVYIHFALGKALEDVGDYQRAFQHFIDGNALKRREVNYDQATHEQTFEQITKAFGPTVFHRFAGAGDPSRFPIFVLGMPRSGSTLVEQILASHPQIHAAGELRNLGRVVRRGRRHRRPTGCVSGLDAGGRRRHLASIGSSVSGKPADCGRGQDPNRGQAPSNFLYVGLIRLILPHARIIHTVRDPADTCVSCFCRLFAQGQAFSYDLAELGRFYCRYHELMAHWRSVLPAGVMLDVSYEDVVDNLEEQARRLTDFCGLPWDDRCLSFHQTSRPIATASNIQVRRPLYRDSVARWQRYKPWLGPLLAELEPCRQPT